MWAATAAAPTAAAAISVGQPPTRSFTAAAAARVAAKGPASLSRAEPAWVGPAGERRNSRVSNTSSTQAATAEPAARPAAPRRTRPGAVLSASGRAQDRPQASARPAKPSAPTITRSRGNINNMPTPTATATRSTAMRAGPAVSPRA